MNQFPTTSTTLLAKLVEIETGVDQAAWYRFFERYQPVMVEFARAKGAGNEAEDVVQEVFADLAKTFESGRYVCGRGRFRSYLAAMLRNELIDRFRRMRTHGGTANADARGANETSHMPPIGRALTSYPEDGSMRGDMPAEFDAIEDDDERAWKLANHRAAVKHVLTKTAISEQSRRIYRELLATGDSCAKVARRLGLPAATVRQVKSRVSRMIVACEKATECV